MALGDITETRTYLTFTLDQEDFAVDVVGVREVLDYTTVTRVPRTPDFMKGVINLRGSVVPVVDLRLKFGLPETENTVDTCVIVLEVDMEGEITVIGAIADSVKEVFELDSASIEPPPRLGTRFDTEFISGMGKHNDDFIIILDVNRVFSSQEMEFFIQTEKGEFGLQSEKGIEGGEPVSEKDAVVGDFPLDEDEGSQTYRETTENSDTKRQPEEKPARPRKTHPKAVSSPAEKKPKKTSKSPTRKRSS